MNPPLTQRLYLRLWLAVVVAVTVLAVLFGWIWRLEAEHERLHRPGREIVLHDANGEIVGHAVAQSAWVPGSEMEFEVPTRDGQTLWVYLPWPNPQSATYIQPWWRPPFDLVWLPALLALAVALGTYPIVRRLTRRLETLQQGVQNWGEGDLSRRLPENGQDEVAFLAQHFNRAAEQVQVLLLSHKTLLANASHELRSPLARIRMGLELMGSSAPALDTAQDSPSAAGTRSIPWKDEIARNIHELDQLIDEILLASRLDAGPPEAGTVEPVDLVGLCAEECARTNAELVLPTGDPALVVRGEAKLLHRLVRNLLDNAHRHAASAATLTLLRQEGQAVMRVCDRGPGVPPELRERIFEPFYRLPNASERGGGVGLGLALVKSIILRHGGAVRCEERPGGGSCFVVEFPLVR